LTTTDDGAAGVVIDGAGVDEGVGVGDEDAEDDGRQATTLDVEAIEEAEAVVA